VSGRMPHSVKSSGFTLIEVLVALAIAATALVAMTGRLGASSDVQHTLSLQTLMLDTALDLMERQRLSALPPTDSQDGDVTVRGVDLHWRLWSEEAGLDGFLRQNLTVSAAHEPDLSLFLYRRAPAAIP